MFCSKCGHELKDGVKFCPNCGMAVGAGQKIREAASEVFNSAEKELGSAIGEVEDTISGKDSVRNQHTAESMPGSNESRPQPEGGSDIPPYPAVPVDNGSYKGDGYGSMGDGSERLKDDRGLLSYILLNLITCGIYGYYFIYKMAHDVNIACDGDGEETSGLVAFILLSIITCGIYSWYWYYKLGNRLSANAGRYGLYIQENGTTVLLWCIFGVLICGVGPYIAMYILIKNANMICNAYNRQHGLA